MKLTESQKHWIINEFFLIFSEKYEAWIHIANRIIEGEEVAWWNGHGNMWFGRPVNKFIETRVEDSVSNSGIKTRTCYYKLNIEEFLKSDLYRVAYNKRIESLVKKVEEASYALSDMDNIAPVIN